jgi:putative ABC transport system ATP-binding protein
LNKPGASINRSLSIVNPHNGKKPGSRSVQITGPDQMIGMYGGSMAVLIAKQLRKSYNLGNQKVEALAGVDFIVEAGEFVAIMGPSGSGKSTLLHLIGGLDKASDGEITLAGKSLSVLKDKQITYLRRRNVGFVFQFFNLLPTLTAEENILLPLLIDGKNIAKYSERMNSLIDLIGLTDRRKHKPEQLSGGEQQRVALARALITEPAIVLADEPTGNLDTKTGQTIMELLRQSCDVLHQTTVIVTHDPRAASYADRVVFLRDGVIVNDVRFENELIQTQRLRMIIEEMERLESLPGPAVAGLSEPKAT